MNMGFESLNESHVNEGAISLLLTDKYRSTNSIEDKDQRGEYEGETAPPGPSGRPSTLSQSQRSVLPSSALAPAPAPAPTPILPPNPAAGPAPHISSIAMNLIIDSIITGVVKGLAPFFDHLTAILLQIQQEAVEARQEEKAREAERQ
ncbi:hypothetical protein EDD18DRAFT_1112448 [Armillaria luteobubalina]|uniref:Uncharacterized protein n=1 Tax=Armillaria luteobubalina TaxID=153913 RepID=A0AA39PGP6_9AGAR|nr:hypothetical protein EDD18DRAFT_1112448 [Armillaria luteobubalina]